MGERFNKHIDIVLYMHNLNMCRIFIISAITTETNIIPIKKLLVCTMKAMTNPTEDRIGSKSLWNTHIKTVANISTKMDQYEVSEVNYKT